MELRLDGVFAWRFDERRRAVRPTAFLWALRRGVRVVSQWYLLCTRRRPGPFEKAQHGAYFYLTLQTYHTQNQLLIKHSLQILYFSQWLWVASTTIFSPPHLLWNSKTNLPTIHLNDDQAWVASLTIWDENACLMNITKKTVAQHSAVMLEQENSSIDCQIYWSKASLWKHKYQVVKLRKRIKRLKKCRDRLPDRRRRISQSNPSFDGVTQSSCESQDCETEGEAYLSDAAVPCSEDVQRTSLALQQQTLY